MDILKIKINPDFQGSINEPQTNLRWIWVFGGIGMLNFLAEYFIRRYASDFFSSVFLESFHILIYFILPIVFFGKNKKLFLVLLLFFFILSSLLYYFFALENYGRYLSLLFLVLMGFYFLIIGLDRGLKTKLSLLLPSRLIDFIVLVLSCFLVVGHIVFVVFLSNTYSFNVSFIWSAWPDITYLVFGILGSEIFFRGMVFNFMNRDMRLPFWVSAGFSTMLFVGPFLANPFFTGNAFIGSVIVFYLFILGFLSCFLLKITKSIFPSYIVNVLVGIVRYLVIQGPI